MKDPFDFDVDAEEFIKKYNDCKARKPGLSHAMSTCLLSANYMCTMVGIGIGVAIGIKKKSQWPLVAAGIFGSIGDIMTGYFYNCRQEISEYQKADSYIRKYNMFQKLKYGDASKPEMVEVDMPSWTSWLSPKEKVIGKEKEEKKEENKEENKEEK
jgi:hypothetical protein